MHNSIESNYILDKLPAHLQQYIKPQDYHLFTSVDQAVWRYVMRKNVAYLKNVAHESYVEGLAKTGIEIERIPSMYGMNRILQSIGWAAAAVDGLIPSAAFMEFQAYNVLVIASDIRTLEHIEYTPTPDIIHESAGHAPILADPEYAEYLRKFGQIGCKAISSVLDGQIYEAVRAHSILCEDPNSTKAQIDEAEQKVIALQNKLGGLSEMTQIRNLHWWTVEYGLIGTPRDYKIYGAGLLSSIGESRWCMQDKVSKHVFGVQAANVNFDVTQPQPQLFVTPNFAYLSQVLEEYANTMALRKGGLEGVEKLIVSEKLGTVELSSGLQVSGIFSHVYKSNTNRGQPAYIKTTGPTALANRERELIGHGQIQHPHGFGFPVGKLKGVNLPIEEMSPRELEAYNIVADGDIHLQFESGVEVMGNVVTGVRNMHGKLQLIYIKDCIVTYQGEALYTPDFGIYHMAVGRELISAFAGPADLESFDLLHHKVQDDERVALVNTQTTYYQAATEFRTAESVTAEQMLDNFEAAKSDIPGEWLYYLDLYETAEKRGFGPLRAAVLAHLQSLKEQYPKTAHLIDDGLQLMELEANQMA